MSAITSSIIEKIQKLQALADNAGTEHEAALAAQRVAELCLQHNLDIGVAQLAGEETEASESRHVLPSSRWQAHWTHLGCACDNLFGVAHYRTTVAEAIKNDPGIVTGRRRGTAIVFYGLKASVASAVLTFEYLAASVEAMLEGYVTENNCFGVSERRSFRLGCSERIHNEAYNLSRAARQHIAANPVAASESMALVQLERGLIKAHHKKLHLVSSGRTSGASSRDHYSAGYAAGGRVDLHGARSSRMLR